MPEDEDDAAEDRDRDVADEPLHPEPRPNRDPVTGSSGAHPAGVGVGALSGATAGAAVGALAGLAGAAIGSAIGAAAGGLAGKALAENINPTREDEFWREHYRSRPYIEEGASYEAYRPAYRYGWESYGRYGGRSFDEVEPELSRQWPQHEGSARLGWEKAKMAVRDAWDRVERAFDPKR